MNKYKSQSKYYYPNTNILINKLEIKDEEKLNKAERIFTTKRIAELDRKPKIGNFSLRHLQSIHKHIFQDIYEFAGQIRDENIAKGTTQFASPMYIESYSKELHQHLKSERYLKGLKVDDFSRRAAYYMSEINMLHPFREGNGRTQREYIRTLALKNGYDLDWSRVDQKALLDASIQSVLNPDALGDIIHKTIVNDEPNRSLIRLFDENTLER
ncbi:Fic family protein [Bacillus gobiensis]|uniref:Fic/DOC family protein n=1 Tax=Bacillus gobiensis TaxID=1441095 RepID=UPI003D1F4E7F